MQEYQTCQRSMFNQINTINTMKRTSILIVLFVCNFYHVMANKALTHDTITIQAPTTSQLNDDNTDKSCIKPEYSGFRIMNIDTPNNYYNFITDKLCENICFFSPDSTADNTKKKKKKKNILMTVSRISNGEILYKKTSQLKGQKYILSKTSLTELGLNNTTITDFATGSPILQTKNVHSYLCYTKDKLYLVPQTYLNNRPMITAYSLTTGKTVWQNKFINIDYGLTTCQPIDSVSDYVVSGDLFRVNWETGDIKKLDCKTSITNKKQVLASAFIGMAAGVASGAVTGSITGIHTSVVPIYYPTTNNNYNTSICPPNSFTIGGLNSNIIQDSGKNYFADRNTLYCFDDDMNKTWDVKLPEKATRSEIFLKGDTICMVNLALAIYGNSGKKAMEKPYVATFSATDGKLFSYQPMDIEDQNVLSCTSSNDQLYLLFPDREAIYNTINNQIEIFDTDTTHIGGFKYYIGKGQMYKRNSDNSFSEIKPTNNTVPIMTNNGYVVDVENGNPTVLATSAETYGTIARHDDMTFIVGKRSKFLELWLLKNGEATLINDRINSVSTKNRNIILCLDNWQVQVLNY